MATIIMNKFDEKVSDILNGSKIKEKQRLRLRKGKLKLPNTPGNRPASNISPALRSGINQDIADTPMPLSIGV